MITNVQWGEGSCIMNGVISVLSVCCLCGDSCVVWYVEWCGYDFFAVKCLCGYCGVVLCMCGLCGYYGPVYVVFVWFGVSMVWFKVKEID